MSAWARPGVRCICIVATDEWRPDRNPADVPELGFPVRGEVYTIATVEDEPEGLFLTLFELGEDDLFDVDSFRPLVSEADDVALFAHHLDQVGEPA